MIQRRSVTPESAYMRLEVLCNRAEHSTGELRERMRRWGLTPDDADRVIARLAGRRLVDDARFARMFVREKIEYCGWGRRKIAMALRTKVDDAEAAAEALDDIDLDAYDARLAEIVGRKLRSLPDAASYESRTKAFRFAVGRGFEPDRVIKAIQTFNSTEY